MANELHRLVIAPAVDYDQVRAYARKLRESGITAVLTYCTLEGARPRNPEVRSAKAVGVRVVDLDTRAHDDALVALAAQCLELGNFLYRHVDDEGTDVCLPGPEWLATTFAAHDLAWLLEPEEAPMPWKCTNLQALPQNPSTLDVEFPFSLSLLQVFAPGQSISCPRCGVAFVPKRPRTQCPSERVLTVIELFKSRDDALRVEDVPLDAWGHGRCPRCRASRQFTRHFEQCVRCGRLMRGEPGRHSLTLVDNRNELDAVRAAAAEMESENKFN